MKYLLLVLCACCGLCVQGKPVGEESGKTTGVENGKPNLALCLDGKDNNVRIGMGILEPAWTLEAWIKGNDTQWNEVEAIIGGGEYSAINWVDDLPLVVKNGKLHSTRANLTASGTLDDRWHHVALTCDGERTVMFIDGNPVAQADTAWAILPGAIGVHDNCYTFGGLIDEVRVWRSALPAPVIQKWMCRPVEREHP